MAKQAGVTKKEIYRIYFGDLTLERRLTPLPIPLPLLANRMLQRGVDRHQILFAIRDAAVVR